MIIGKVFRFNKRFTKEAVKNFPKKIIFYTEKNTRKGVGKGFKTVQGVLAKRVNSKTQKITNKEVFDISNAKYNYVDRFVIPQINEFYTIALNSQLTDTQQNNLIAEAFARPIRTGRVGKGFFNNFTYKVTMVYTGQMLSNIRAVKVKNE